MKPERGKRSSESDSFRRKGTQTTDASRLGTQSRLWAVFKRGSAHEPSPLARDLHGERLRRSQVVEILGVMRVRGLSFTPLNRPLQEDFGGLPLF